MIFQAKCHAIYGIRNGEKTNLTQLLTLSEKEAHAFDDDEIDYKGKLYDVIKKMIARDSVTFYLYPDDEEQDALIDLVDYFSSDKRNSNANADKICLFKTSHENPDQVIPRFTRFEIVTRGMVSSPALHQISHKIPTRHILVPTPPPKQFLI
jgi:hypothetical protein